MHEVRKHMEYENDHIFSYVKRLLAGEKVTDFRIAQYSSSHDGMEHKLQELKNIIIKYYSPSEKTSCDLLCYVLFSIYNSEADLHAHCDMEDSLFFPAVQLLEEKIANNQFNVATDSEDEDGETLTDREKQIVACVVRGLTNREVAEHLYISINTVLTHRRNISRKLDIHSVSGLTIYAIVNGIVQIDEVSLN